MIALTRPCPVPGCPSECANGHPMCRPCWRLVSPRRQDAEMRAHEAWTRGDLSDDDYEWALLDAVRSSQDAARAKLERSDRYRRPRPGAPRTLRPHPAPVDLAGKPPVPSVS